jgi:hypothetical protein
LGRIWAKLAKSKRGPSKQKGQHTKAAAAATLLEGIEQNTGIGGFGHGGGGGVLVPGWNLGDLSPLPLATSPSFRSFYNLYSLVSSFLFHPKTMVACMVDPCY